MITVFPYTTFIRKKYFFEAQLGARKLSKQSMRVVRIGTTQAFTLTDTPEENANTCRLNEEMNNKPLYVLILKRVLISLHVYFPTQQEIISSSLEGIKIMTKLRLLGAGILIADQKSGERDS